MRTTRAFNLMGLVSLLLVLVWASQAWAQEEGAATKGKAEQGAQPRVERAGGGETPQQFIDRNDTNKDGKVSADEFRGPRARFDQMDTNKDGFVTAEEFTASPQPRRGGGDRAGGFAGFQEQMMNRLKDQLGATAEEWSALQPRIQKVMDAQMKTRMMMGRGMFGRRGGPGGMGGPGGGPGGPGGPGGMPGMAPMPEVDGLRAAVDDPKTAPEKLKAALSAFRDARKKAESDLQSARDELRKVLTAHQEAVLVMNGMLD